MVADFVAFLQDPLNQAGAMPHLVADHEERGPGLVTCQKIQQAGRCNSIRSVIKGQGDRTRFSPAGRHDGQEKLHPLNKWGSKKTDEKDPPQRKEAPGRPHEPEDRRRQAGTDARHVRTGQRECSGCGSSYRISLSHNGPVWPSAYMRCVTREIRSATPGVIQLARPPACSFTRISICSTPGPGDL